MVGNALMRRVGLALCGCLAALGVVEAAVRVFAPQPPLMYWPHPVYGWTHPAGKRYSVLVEETGRRVSVEINSKGLRDREIPYDKPAGTFRILALGDSFTEGTYVELAQTYVKRLEDRLVRSGMRAEVINAGVGSYGTDQELLWLMREGVKYHPNLVLVGFYTGNDVEDNITKTLCRLEHGRLVIDEQGESRASRRALTLVKAWLQDHLQTYLFVKKKTDQMYVVRRLLGGLGLAEAHDAESLKYDREHWHKPLPKELRVFLKDAPPDVQAGWQLTTAILERMRRVTDEAGAKPLVVVIPTAYQVDPARYRSALAEVGLTESAMDLEGPQRILSEWGRTNGVAVLDLLPEFRRRTEAGERAYLREGHWNERGHDEAAAVMFNMLRHDGLVSGAS